jgi:type 1 fimbria pilin
VELTVVPRGALRWNLSGINPKEGTPYTGPIEVPGSDDVTLYVYAEDNGVTARRDFNIPRPNQQGTVIDKQKPAVLRKKQTQDGNGPAFTTIKCAKEAKASFVGLSIEVGKGSKNALTRFGGESTVTADAVDTFIKAARAALAAVGRRGT